MDTSSRRPIPLEIIIDIPVWRSRVKLGDNELIVQKGTIHFDAEDPYGLVKVDLTCLQAKVGKDGENPKPIIVRGAVYPSSILSD